MENLKNIQPIDNFDWDALEKGESYGSVSKEDLVKTYDETLNTVKDKEVVMGTVTAMNKREVVVNIGFKSDGVVPMSEFRYNPDLKIGDEVEVYIESQEDKKGQLILSHKKAQLDNDYQDSQPEEHYWEPYRPFQQSADSNTAPATGNYPEHSAATADSTEPAAAVPATALSETVSENSEILVSRLFFIIPLLSRFYHN